MAISNPLVLLPVNDDNSLQDLYDEKLFEFKQFFSRQLPTTKLFYAKLKKLKQITEAYLELGGEEVFMRGVSVAYQQYNSPDVKSGHFDFSKPKQRFEIENEFESIV